MIMSALSFVMWSDLTEDEWIILREFIPDQPLRGRKRRTNLRRIIEVIFYVVHTGCPWRSLPVNFPSRSTVYDYFQKFCRNPIWDHFHDHLYHLTRNLAVREESPSYAILDSQSVKTGCDARGDVGYDASKKVRGRKRHILVDILGMMLKVTVHSASIQDRDVTFPPIVLSF